MYSDEDFLKLQKILSLKYLGFSLNEIGNMTIHDTSADILKSLKMQIGLVHKKMENLEQMEKALPRRLVHAFLEDAVKIADISESAVRRLEGGSTRVCLLCFSAPEILHLLILQRQPRRIRVSAVHRYD